MTAVPPRPAAPDRYWLCTDDCTTDCGACKGAGRPAAPDATAGDGLRARAERIVANWRVNFDHDDDRPLINMIETALRDVLAAAARDAELRVRIETLTRDAERFPTHDARSRVSASSLRYVLGDPS